MNLGGVRQMPCQSAQRDWCGNLQLSAVQQQNVDVSARTVTGTARALKYIYIYTVYIYTVYIYICIYDIYGAAQRSTFLNSITFIHIGDNACI